MSGASRVSWSVDVAPNVVREGRVSAPFTIRGLVRGRNSEEGRPLAQVKFTGEGTMVAEFVRQSGPDEPDSPLVYLRVSFFIERGTTRMVNGQR